MLSLSFYEALVLFAVALTFFYLLCLLLPHKKDPNVPILKPNRGLLLICGIILGLFCLSPFMVALQGPRPMWFFVFLVITFIVSYVTVFAYRSWKLALIVNVLITSVFSLSIFSALGAMNGGTAFVSDGFDIAAKYIIRDGNFGNAGLNEPYFEFFPATSTLYATLSINSGLNVSASFVILGVLQTALFAAVITVLLKFFSESPIIAVLAVPFILSNPRLGVWQPHASFLSLLFGTLLIYLLLLRITPAPNAYSGKIFPFLFVLLGFSSVAHHTSGAMFIVALICGLIIFEIAHRKLSHQPLLNWRYAARLLSFFLVLALAYWIYTFALYSMLPRVRNTINGLWDFLQTGNPVYNYLPKQTLESPIQAYSWAVPVAIAASFILFSIIQYLRKKAVIFAPAKQYTNIFLVSAVAISIPLIISAFAFKLATTAASSERYFSAAPYLLLLLAAPLIIQKMSNTKLAKSLVFCSVIVLLLVGATSYTWNIDNVVGKPVALSESTGIFLSSVVADNSTIFSENPYLTSQIALNGNLAIKEGRATVFNDLTHGHTMQADSSSKATIYLSEKSTTQAINLTQVNVLYASGQYHVLSP
ncbi:MAG: hypothetical protein NWE96_00170 [Candidatus Bathyarchaeota archaeon]|nr:hypothetical protein [Candidatus Bathyarchaeota archaeon]